MKTVEDNFGRFFRNRVCELQGDHQVYLLPSLSLCKRHMMFCNIETSDVVKVENLFRRMGLFGYCFAASDHLLRLAAVSDRLMGISYFHVNWQILLVYGVSRLSVAGVSSHYTHIPPSA